MLGLFNRFGRARDLRLLDQAVRAAGLHPALVPEAVKLTAMRLLRAQGRVDGNGVDEASAAAAADLLAYCMLGPSGFVAENGPARTEATERRLEAAIDAGESLDASLVLLALHAKIVQPGVIERYGLEAG